MRTRTSVALTALLGATVTILGQEVRLTSPQKERSWPTATPSAVGIDPALLDAIYAELTQDAHHDLKGVVILRDGKLVSERYFNGDSAETLHDIRSATKSITSLLMGVAIQQGIVQSVDDSIATYLPGLQKGGNEKIHIGKEKIQIGTEKIHIKDLLNMRSGLDADDEDPASPGNEDRLDESTDWIPTVYSVPMKRAPGEKYVYCSINAFLTGAIVENASHTSLDNFAKKNLFTPLGISQYEWRHLPVDRGTGQGNLSITTRDEAAVGELMLDDGIVNRKRVLNHDWIEASLAKQVAISGRDPYADFYGYMWYTRAEPVGDHKIEVHFASGNGGNKIYIVPSLHMVVAITSSAYGHGYGQRRSQDILLKILAASSSK